MKLRIATWNLDRSHDRGKWRIEAQQRALEAQAADVYLLTEVDERFKISERPGVHFSDPGNGSYAATEHAAGIWTRLSSYRISALTATPQQSMPLECGRVAQGAIKSRDSRHVACGTFDSTVGPIVLYSTIIPWHAARHVPGDRHWIAHRRSLAAQIEDWAELRRRLPDHHLLIAGDFNMTLGSSTQYGDRESREKLREACTGLGLKCLTDLDLPRVREGGKDNIDHIVVSDGFTALGPPRPWMQKTSDGRRFLSDHCGLTVDLTIGA